MAATRMLKLERIQYRCLRIVLGMMQPTHVQMMLGDIGGVSPLRLRFSMLNHKYLILAFSTGGHPLRQILAVLLELNSTKMFRALGIVEVYDYPLEALLHTCPTRAKTSNKNKELSHTILGGNLRVLESYFNF
jgi:hypothetical protein